MPTAFPWDHIATALLTALGTLWVARRTRWGAFDLAVLEKRLEWYPKLTKTTEFLALYFPASVLDSARCERAGYELRACYFDGVGILLSADARDRYFMLVEALARAGVAARLDVPGPIDYPTMISVRQVDEYRQRLGIGEPTMESVQDWQFGSSQHDPALQTHQKATERSFQSFRDFIFLQTLASRLRSELSSDIIGRRRPQ